MVEPKLTLRAPVPPPSRPVPPPSASARQGLVLGGQTVPAIVPRLAGGGGQRIWSHWGEGDGNMEEGGAARKPL